MSLLCSTSAALICTIQCRSSQGHLGGLVPIFVSMDLYLCMYVRMCVCVFLGGPGAVALDKACRPLSHLHALSAVVKRDTRASEGLNVGRGGAVAARQPGWVQHVVRRAGQDRPRASLRQPAWLERC